MVCPECNGTGETVYFVEVDRDENSVTCEEKKGICRTCKGSGKKPMTNADLIRVMSDEEIARFICRKTTDCKCPGEDLCCFGDGEANGMVKWLKQPAEDE